MSLALAYAIILTTLEEVKTAPLSAFYLPLIGKISLLDFYKVIAIIEKHGMAHSTSETLSFVPPAEGTKGFFILATLKKQIAASNINPEMN